MPRLSGHGNCHSGNQKPMIPESGTGILPCGIIRLAQPKLKVSQHRIALSSDVLKKTADKVLKDKESGKKVTEKKKRAV